MRVGLFIDTHNFGGAEAVVTSIASFLTEQTHDVVLYHFGNDYLERSCVRLGIRDRRVGDEFFYKKTYRLPIFAARFSRALKADRLDLLHSHLFGSIVAGGLSCRLSGIPHIGTLHDVYIVEERPVRAKLLFLVHVLGTRLVCVSDQMAEYYASVTGIDRAKLMVIKNGVDIAKFATGDRPTGPRDVLRLIMVGRLDRIKRHDLLFDALDRLGDRRDWHVDIVGDGPERQALEERCRQLGLAEHIAFLGQRDDVPRLLADSDLFVLVSDSEGMSLSLIEAIASGLPVIATRVGNNAELVTDGQNGFLIPPGGIQELASALAALLDDERLRREFGARSRQLASEQLDVGRTLSSYMALYERTVTE